MTETTATAVETTKSCQCGMYFAVTAEWNDPETDQPEETTESTGCHATTTRDFAPGHDAKLKGYLIRWGAAGYEVAFVDGGVRVGTTATAIAHRYGFGHMVDAGIAKAVAKQQERQAKADAKHARKAAKAQAPTVSLVREIPKAKPAPVEGEPAAERIATIKVGRWTYPATIWADGTATYRSKLGQAKVAEAGTYTEV